MSKIHPDIYDCLILSRDSDVYGWVTFHLFGIADALYAFSGNVPDGWNYSPGLSARQGEVVDWPASEYLDLLRYRHVSTNQMLYAGEVLRRYVRLVTRHGLAY